MSIHTRRKIVLPLLLAGLASLAQAAPLSFTTALELAELQSPKLAATIAQIDAVRSAAIPAGALPDPKVFAGIDNFTDRRFNRMRPSIAPRKRHQAG